nr:DUF4125 family protein [uncultured Oscillibacter sp.]
MEGMIKSVVAIEWALFDKVQNCGGRAACQDDAKTFSIMRASQFRAWSLELLESYKEDLLYAQAQGRNPLCEKYAYMMERTSPDEYQQIKDALPVPSLEDLFLADLICATHVAWQEELAKRYPRLIGQGRPIRREADAPGVTSFETYLRGELLTYSVETLRLYVAFVEKGQKEKINLCEQVLRNTVLRYGYPDLEAAEEHQAKRN